MRCEKCGGNMKVVRTREKTNSVYRERRCSKCGSVVYTKEVEETGASYQLKKLISPVEKGNANELHS